MLMNNLLDISLNVQSLKSDHFELDMKKGGQMKIKV